MTARASSPPWLRPECVDSWRRIALLLTVMIAPFLWSSFRAALHGSSTRYLLFFIQNRPFLGQGAVEASMLAGFFYLLHRGGWRPADFSLRFSWWAPLQALGLWAATFVANAGVVVVMLVLGFYLRPHHGDFLQYLIAQRPIFPHGPLPLAWSVLILFSILNAYFEELVFMGYAFNQFAAKRGPAIALAAVLVLRVGVHAYQGFAHAAGIGAVFLIFALWYWATRRLGSLVLAHALIDIASLGLLKAVHFG
jgi:membrane protease YdiL (CAAX protease family)